MDTDKLTNYQLYTIIQNKKIDKEIRKTADKIFANRFLPDAEIEELDEKYNSYFTARRKEPLQWYYKAAAFAVPFLWGIHILISSRYLSRGQKRKWNEYWICFCAGLLAWTVIAVVYGGRGSDRIWH